MHDVDQTTEQMVRSVLAYAENRLRMDPVPLDKRHPTPADLYRALDRLIRDRGRAPDEVLGVYSSVIAPSIISADSPRFLGFIPAAPTKASLLFDMLISCASIQGISWLEASGAIAAENTVLRLIADEAGLPAGAGGCFVSGRVGRQPVGARGGPGDRQAAAGRRGRRAAGCGSWSAPTRTPRSSNTLRLLEMDALVVDTPDHRLTAEAVQAAIDADARPSPTSSAVVCTSGTTNAGIVDDLAGRRRDREGARLVVPRRRRLRRVGDLRPIAASRSTPASSWRTRSSSIRTSGCSPRSTAARCSTASPNWPGPHTPRTRPTWTSSTPSDGEWNPTDYAYHLTRRARGLPLWFSLAVYGRGRLPRGDRGGGALAQETAT